MQSHFAPGYAYPTQHPYAQYTGEVTYPGPSILAVAGPLDFLKDNKFYGGAAVGAVLLFAALYFMKKIKK